MSVRSPSRRKALKYGAMAALGLGAGVALGEVTGANRLVHAASPSGPDPVFSGTGIQFPSPAPPGCPSQPGRSESPRLSLRPR